MEIVGQLQEVELERLREHPRNPRRIGREQLAQLKRNLERDPAMLRARPVIALPDGTVIAGIQRLRAARELGWSSVPVVFADVDETTALEWMVRDNTTAYCDVIRDRYQAWSTA